MMTQTFRQRVLCGLLGAALIAWGVMRWQDAVARDVSTPVGLPAAPPHALQPQGAISRLAVAETPDGEWEVVCDIDWESDGPVALLSVEASPARIPASGWHPSVTQIQVVPTKGRQTYRLTLNRPGHFEDVIDDEKRLVVRTHRSVQTERVTATLSGYRHAESLQKTVQQTIRWPDRAIWDADQTIRLKGADAVMNQAVDLIDQASDETLEDARVLLERLLHKNPKFTPAYIELARVAMKTNWGPDGLAQARQYLDSALSIDTGNVNALILRGYVSVHESKFQAAEGDFRLAAKSNPPNLWLWANWGELLVKQGKHEQAIAMYLKAVEQTATQQTYNRARADALAKLIRLYAQRRDVAGQEKMHKIRVKEFGDEGCHLIEFAQFQLQEKTDPDAAIRLVKDINATGCVSLTSKEVMGIAYYLKWASADDLGRATYFNQAKIYFPIGPMLFLQLSGHPSFDKVAQALVKAGERVDAKNKAGMTALALALQQTDLARANRLLSLGANPQARVGEQNLPVALIPVINDDVDGVRLMRKSGVRYESLEFQGMTALGHAKQTGNRRMLNALGGTSPKI